MISIRQVIRDIKKSYIDLTGDTEQITYGNIAEKIRNITTGGGGGDNVNTKKIGFEPILYKSIDVSFPTNEITINASATTLTQHS